MAENRFSNYELRELFREAYESAKRSPDTTTQIAALLIDERGMIVVGPVCNKFPTGIRQYPDGRLERPLKYKYMEHAERGVLYRAARGGMPTRQLTMVCPWAPCSDCARAIIECGIKCLIVHKQAHERMPSHWQEDIETGLSMLREAGVEVIFYDGPVGVEGILCDGVRWNP